MSKKALIDQVVEASGGELTKKQAKAAVNALTDVIHRELSLGNEVAIPEVGKFTVRNVAARRARNPRTGEAIDIAGHRAPKFSVSSVLKRALA